VRRGGPELVVNAVFERFVEPIPYLHVLDRIHQHLLPRTYVEIGVHIGSSLMQVLPGTETIGIDPEARLYYPVHGRTQVHKTTSDEFFRSHDVSVLLDGLPVDLSFIDGMHQFEFALRDFMNLERWSSPKSVVLVHDCLPANARQASRTHVEGTWSGDVWKLVVCLKTYRPDLEIAVADVAPTGLGIIKGLDPSSTVLRDRYEEICERVVPLTYEWLEKQGKAEQLNRIDGDWESVRGYLPPTPFREAAVLPLTAKRLAITTRTMAPRWVSAKARLAAAAARGK
jgi:hypothetical protein